MLNESKDRAKPFERGQEQAEAMLAMQKELLETCDQASRAWLDRVKSEVDRAKHPMRCNRAKTADDTSKVGVRLMNEPARPKARWSAGRQSKLRRTDAEPSGLEQQDET